MNAVVLSHSFAAYFQTSLASSIQKDPYVLTHIYTLAE